jgi:branched-chain amino acid transport system permease protein
MNSLIQAIVSGILIGGVYSLIAIGLTLVFGVMKIVNFAHGSLMMLGMYIAYWLFVLLRVDPYISLFISMIALFLFGYAIQKYFINRILEAPEYMQILFTIAIGLLIDNTVLLLWHPNFRSVQVSYGVATLTFGSINVSITRLIAFGFALLLTVMLFIFLKKTDIGKALRAASLEKEGALLVGINVQKLYMIAFGIGAACVGAAGTLVTPFFYIYPYVGGVFVIMAFIIVVMGGMGNFIGALVCGIIIGVSESVAALFLPGSSKQIIPFLIFIVILLFKPTGIFRT